MTSDGKQTSQDLYAEYKIAWDKRRKAERQRLLQEAEHARDVARQCALLLADRYPIQRVWLIGSLLDKERFHHGSDVDLVVEGLNDRDYFPALAKLYELLPAGLELDLITLESAQSSLHKLVMQKGELLYERA
ncbi:MAG: nucleotidyltransferase domain-containing protein [Chloroflexi bacterium]|nr:nucleotidyltransferase domain-containing protein [Chloroflexota bacterium]